MSAMRFPVTSMSAIRTMLALACLVGGASAAQAQDFPTKPIRIIVGPSPDAVPRVLAPFLQKLWGQPLVIEARTGAGGLVAANAVTTADPDGHTLLFTTPSYTLGTALKTATYDVVRDFAPAVLIGTGAYTLTVHPSVPAKSVAELVAYLKANPGKINCASAGLGTAPQVACETFNKMPGVSVVHVPYRNVNAAMNDLVAGQVQMFVAVSLVAKQQMQAGTVRGLATTGPKRSELLPQLPTIAESGYPEFILSGWNGFLAPAGTPKPVLEKINAGVQQALKDPEVRQRLVTLGQEFVTLDVEGFTKFVHNDVAHWTKLVEAIGRDKLTPPKAQ
jgi:tripartite-type tricarboxylate transporter receptor subunit TctC